MRDLGENHAAVTGEPAAPKRCTAGSGRRPLEKDPHSGNLASGLPVLVHGTAPGHGFLIKLDADEEVVRLEVHDSRSRHPQARRAADTDTSGRGLVLVNALADGWGVQDRPPFGKIVWACFKAAGETAV
ncbi:ATP-binding protein [Streptomyces celluloflavus]|uniref:ATP-binding protein n=1 Tax=Streptomyces celluloflavus TaxID=58344 RepID=A0ABW7R7T1_9ACTN|nr:ATP-binding protein [Streptomyces celluloflavus]